jgi:hypothetical protein
MQNAIASNKILISPFPYLFSRAENGKARMPADKGQALPISQALLI